MLRKYPEILDAKDSNDESPIIYAAKTKSKDCLCLLQKLTSDYEIYSQDGLSLLSILLINEIYASASIILDKGAKIDQVSPLGKTALHEMVERKLKD